MDSTLVQLLEQVGLTQKEARVYLALLELGEGTVTKIAKSSELKRSIIYVILEGLIKRNYAQEISNKKIETYKAFDPSVILNKLKTTSQHLSEMLPFLRTLGNEGLDKPKITYYDTLEDTLRMYKQWTYYDSGEENIFIASYVRMEELMPGIFDEWLRYYKKKKHRKRERHLVPNTSKDIAIGTKIAHETGQEVRMLTELNDIKMDFSILENKLIITSFEKNPFIVVIESEELIKSMKPIFEIAWAKGKKIPPSNPKEHGSTIDKMSKKHVK